MNTDKQPTKIRTFRLTDGTIAMLDALARAWNITRTDALKRLVVEGTARAAGKAR